MKNTGILKVPRNKKNGLKRLTNRFTKYGNQWTEYRGVKYASRLEAQYAQYLDSQMKSKSIAFWERQISIPLVVCKQPIARYVMDFVVTQPSGERHYVEIKGMKTDVWKLKVKLFRALYPKLIYTVLYKKDVIKLLGDT